ncbi:tyrosine protein kinase:aminoglycoside phosphotransferase [Camelimonas fluminis]|nr:tyrosine protein kinase:aminoglycoside phosphotransferase [Camelimonas fluminis]
MKPATDAIAARTTLDDQALLTHELSRIAGQLAPGATAVVDMTRLSGGASQETWAFRAVGGSAVDVGLILRRAPGGWRQADGAAGLETEAAVIRAAGAGGVPVPEVIHVLAPEDGVGRGFITRRVEGETIARKILRDAEFAQARTFLAEQCGGILAHIAKVDVAALPPLRLSPARQQLDDLLRRWRGMNLHKPVFELAFRWLAERCPPDPAQPVLVHGDFRNGNLIIGPDGVRAVLDWEIAHLGDPMEDLAWICVNSWRFGALDKPAGGFGSREQLFAGYEKAGGRKVDPQQVRFWEALGSLRWGIACTGMIDTFRSGLDAGVERAMIARRASETEIDLLNLIAPRA